MRTWDFVFQGQKADRFHTVHALLAAQFGAIAVVSAAGASCAYWLSRLLLRHIVVGLFPARVASFARQLSRHRASLVNFLIFIRVTPFLPSWFINLAVRNDLPPLRNSLLAFWTQYMS